MELLPIHHLCTNIFPLCSHSEQDDVGRAKDAHRSRHAPKRTRKATWAFSPATVRQTRPSSVARASSNLSVLPCSPPTSHPFSFLPSQRPLHSSTLERYTHPIAPTMSSSTRKRKQDADEELVALPSDEGEEEEEEEYVEPS